MRLRYSLICCATLTLAGSITGDAFAGRRVRSNPSPTPTTVLPSGEELSAVPIPEQGRILAYPVDAVRYGATVHPGARIVRGIFGR